MCPSFWFLWRAQGIVGSLPLKGPNRQKMPKIVQIGGEMDKMGQNRLKRVKIGPKSVQICPKTNKKTKMGQMSTNPMTP